MSSPTKANLTASVRQRLLNLAKERKIDPNRILVHYGIERLLYRLSVSPHAGQFILKGAMLFAVWTLKPYRSTMDLDLLGYRIDSTAELNNVFREMCDLQVEPDGLHFDPASIQAEDIREDQEYQGQRVRLLAYLGTARINIQVDIGIGDVVIPRPVHVNFPVLLSFPAPRIRAYPKEAVIAEKFHAMTLLGILNSRMKDFFDVWVLASDFEFHGDTLSQAIKATFKRRRADLPLDVPVALTSAFYNDPVKRTMWNVFLNKDKYLERKADLEKVVDLISAFVLPPAKAAADGSEFVKNWQPGGPWK